MPELKNLITIWEEFSRNVASKTCQALYAMWNLAMYNSKEPIYFSKYNPYAKSDYNFDIYAVYTKMYFNVWNALKWKMHMKENYAQFI